ncbi:PAS domain-containing protein [Candidatus Methylobacter oryzae]|uniref:PAS domain S-box protein n=1 Tax=Candidatus Methylobacter oryzae TaxID=2497749 RepID=A0ABY3CEE9_9GAMM|nr:PAS domain-containing protein [Candidatus Methylobacter oryzae]TRX01420.1 PAS domain S-box protein [Candidatus Methylobacter oryzae]
MKKDTTATGREVKLKPGSLLVSLIDLQGIIIDASSEFIAVSGFNRDELIGANHNIVRHLDMPPAVFEDLWSTVKALKPWQGIVKNRTKSGAYYWTKTHVQPTLKDGEAYEYLSVGYALSRHKIKYAELLYRLINDNAAPIESIKE